MQYFYRIIQRCNGRFLVERCKKNFLSTHGIYLKWDKAWRINLKSEEEAKEFVKMDMRLNDELDFGSKALSIGKIIRCYGDLLGD